MSSAQIKVLVPTGLRRAFLTEMGLTSGWLGSKPPPIPNNAAKPNGGLGSVPHTPVQGGPDAAEGQAPSNARFNSFCERFVIERCREWPQEEINEAAWRTIQDAKTVYRMIQGVSSKVKDR